MVSVFVWAAWPAARLLLEYVRVFVSITQAERVLIVPVHSIYRDTDQRLGIFVDVQNMFYSAKSLHQSKVDYGKLLAELVTGRKLVRAIAYVVQKPDVDQSGFLEALRRAGYEVRRKELALRDDGSTRGDWDVGMTIDALSLAPKLDTAVLVTGDGDFALLAEALKARGCRVEVASFEQSTSNELMRCCDQFMPMGSEVLFKEEKFMREREHREREYQEVEDESQPEVPYDYVAEE